MAIAFVQDVANGGNSTSATTAVITVTVTTTVGNHLVLSVVTSAGDLSSVTDSKGNTWQVDLAAGGTHTARVKFASAKITSALVNTDTITITTAVAGRTAGSASEFSGLATTNWFDVSASAEVTAATAGDSGLTATTAQADELLYGATAVVSTVTAFTPEVVSPVWNLLTQGASTVTVRTIIPAYRIIAATGTYAFKSTWTTARDAANGIVTYKAAAAASVDGGPSYRPVILANKHTGPRALRYRFRQPYLRGVDAPPPAGFDPSTGFPWPTAQDDSGPQASLDDTTQAWTIQPPAVASLTTVNQPYDAIQDQSPAPLSDDTAQSYSIQPPAIPFVAVSQGYDPAEAQPAQDDAAQSYSIQPPVVAPFNPASGFPWPVDVQQDAPQNQQTYAPEDPSVIGSPRTEQLAGIWQGQQPDVGAPPSVDETAQAWTIQPPAAAPFDPSTGFPWQGAQPDVPFVGDVDVTSQTYSIQPVAAVVFDPASGFPWTVEDSQQHASLQPVWWDGVDGNFVQSIAFNPASGFPFSGWDASQDQSLQPVWFDPSEQSWAVTAPAAPFNPATSAGFLNYDHPIPAFEGYIHFETPTYPTFVTLPAVTGGVGGPPPTAIAVKPTPFGKAYTERP